MIGAEEHLGLKQEARAAAVGGVPIKPIPFGNYLLLGRINVGGMAEVFKAKAFGVEGFERFVAVKRILPSIAADTEFITMFIDEAKIAVQLTHANIAQIFDLGKVGESYFIAMEYVQGKDLRALFERARQHGEPIAIPMACYVVMKICEGLDYAHNKKDSSGRDLNLVHRDVSPQNLLVSYDGEIKIIDFGIAKAAGKAGTTQAGILKGKFGYMSPEQVRGIPLDRRSDVFALGIVLYELLTGERLFLAESDFSTLEKVRHVEILPPSAYNRNIPEELEKIVLKALSKERTDRYQTAMDLHDDLQSFMYTSGNVFARKDLSQYMRRVFADDITNEAALDEQYASVETTHGFAHGASGATDLDSAASPLDRSVEQPVQRSELRGQAAAGGPRRLPGLLGAGSVPPRAAPPQAPSSPGLLPSAVLTPATPPSSPGGLAARTPPPRPAGYALSMDWDDDQVETRAYARPDATDATPLPIPGGYALAGPPTLGGERATPDRPILQPYRSQSPAPPPRIGSPQPFSGMRFSPATPPSPLAAASVPIAAPLRPSGPPMQRADVAQPTVTTKKPVVGRLLAVAIGLLLVFVVLAAFLAFWPAEPGMVELQTIPADPVVLFDNDPIPATQSPFVIQNVEPSRRHLIEVRKRGYETWMQYVSIEAGQTLRLPPVTLVPKGGSREGGVSRMGEGTGFRLDTEPRGADVIIDGQTVNQQTPVELTDLEPGRHTVRVELQGYAPWQRDFVLEQGEMKDIEMPTLSPLAATISFRSNPSGARVSLVRDGERHPVGNTPTQAEVDLTGKPWVVEMMRSGFAPWAEPLDVPLGKSSYEVRAMLEPRGSGGARRYAAGASASGQSSGGREAPAGEEQEEETSASAQSGSSGARSGWPSGGSSSGSGSQTASAGSQSSGGSAQSGGGGSGGANAGTLRINTRPWSQVFLGNRSLGTTPIMAASLPAGRHRITLHNSEFNIRETIMVEIRAGQTTTKILTLTPGTR